VSLFITTIRFLVLHFKTVYCDMNMTTWTLLLSTTLGPPLLRSWINL